jgi:hypothetical protein
MRCRMLLERLPSLRLVLERWSRRTNGPCGLSQAGTIARCLKWFGQGERLPQIRIILAEYGYFVEQSWV